MKHDETKIIKIMDELISFYFKIGITDINIDLQCGKEEIKISLKGECDSPPLEELDELKELLNAPPQEELEEYYWELVGEGHGYQELNLLGMLVDKASVEHDNNKLKITVYRKK